MNGTTDSSQPGFVRYWRVLREHLRIVAACTLIAVLAAALYAQLATRKYQAQSQMLIAPIDPSNSFTVGLPVLHSSADPTRDALTAASLITTPQIANAVSSALHLHESATTLLGSVTATPVGQSQLIAVQATATSARQAQRIANQFAAQVIRIRTAALHAALAQVIPGLRAQVAAETPAERSSNSTLAGELTQLQQLASSPDPTITLAAPAELPLAPFTPRRKLDIGAGLVGGLLIGIAAAFLFDVLDPRLRREEQIRDVLGLRVLARIPLVKTRSRLGRRSSPILPGQLPFHALEAYRRLRIVLTAGSHGARAFLVTSSDPGDGKTTSAINLAGSIARGGKSVILIEADFRRPTVASLLRLDVARGTEHVAFGQAELASTLISATIDESTVKVLAVHTPRPRLAEQLSAEIAHRLISDAKRLADFVIIDSPPLAAVVDALPLAEAVDDVIIVARLSVSRLSKLTELRDLLGDQGSMPSGFVLIGDHPAGRLSDYTYAPSGRPPVRSAQPPSSPAEVGAKGSSAAEA